MERRVERQNAFPVRAGDQALLPVGPVVQGDRLVSAALSLGSTDCARSKQN